MATFDLHRKALSYCHRNPSTTVEAISEELRLGLSVAEEFVIRLRALGLLQVPIQRQRS